MAYDFKDMQNKYVSGKLFSRLWKNSKYWAKCSALDLFFCRGESIIPFKCITGKKGVLYGIQKASYYSPAPGQNCKCY